MPRSGSGSYTLPAGNPVVPGTTITSTWANTTMSDIGTALTASIAYDGQTVPVANLPMGAFRHTNVGNAVARTDYAAAGQVQDSVMQWLTTVAGTNTITAALSTPPLAAYVAGQTFRFTAVASNTGATTININGLGAKNITKAGTVPLAANDILINAVYQIVYDGVQFQLSQIPAGTLINVQTFSSTGIYTPTPGTNRVVVEAVGGGGGGGSAGATAAGQSGAAGGGGGGSFAKVLVTSAFSGVTVTIGAGGTAGIAPAANGGGTGGTTSFGTILSCPGGIGGGAGTASGAVGIGSQAPGGVAPTISGATTILSSPGWASGTQAMILVAGSVNTSGAGANSPYGVGGRASVGTAGGDAATGKGSGGSGGTVTSSVGSGANGAAGAAGFVIVYEYS